MAVEKLFLTFPKTLVQEPIVYKLIRQYDLEVSIMSASISPDEQGHMVLELKGDRKHVHNAKRYLDRRGVSWQPLIRDVRRLDDRCTHCTACITICPTEALVVDRQSMLVAFHQDKCIACGLCIPVCSYKAMEIKV